jgi:RNA polymerase sigma factor (sigma-70 family)
MPVLRFKRDRFSVVPLSNSERPGRPRRRRALRTQARGDRRERAAAARDGRPPFDSTEAAVLLSAEHQQVLAAVGKLPARQREALMLRYYLGLSTDETAHVMGISTGTVKSALHRAIAALGRTLKEDS